jgi:L-amino acid N-acyltransferase YncA
MFEYSETVSLKDGSRVTVRDTRIEDLDKAFDFFRAMPVEDKLYLRVDVCDKEIARDRYKQIELGKAIRLVADCRGTIVGEATLETMRYGWLRKSGEVKLLVLPAFRDLGLERVMAREIFLLAARLGLNNLIARVLDSEQRTYEILLDLHFKHTATQREHAADAQGLMHDVQLMTFSLKEMWRKMETAIGEADASPLENYY